MNFAAPSTLPFAVSERIAAMIFALCQTVTMRVRGATAPVTQAQMTYIVGRLLGMRKRFNRLVERIRAGKPPRERARKPRAAKPAPDPDFSLGFRPPPPGWRRWAVRVEKPVPLWRALGQHRFGWLLPLAPSMFGFPGSAAAHRARLLLFLEDPESQALLLASRRVGDTLRPLCWMLGIEASLLYPARPAASAAVGAPDPSDGAPVPCAATPPPDQHTASAVATIAAPAALPAARPRARDGDDCFAAA